jgi:hypothetical protein
MKVQGRLESSLLDGAWGEEWCVRPFVFIKCYGPEPSRVPYGLPEPPRASQSFPRALPELFKGAWAKASQRITLRPPKLDITTYYPGIYRIIGQTSHAHKPHKSHTLARDEPQSNTISTRH